MTDEELGRWVEEWELDEEGAEGLGLVPLEKRADRVRCEKLIHTYFAGVLWRDVSGMFEQIGIPLPYGVLFTGASGTGKRTAAGAAAATLLGKKLNYSRLFWLTPEAFDLEGEEDAELKLSVLFPEDIPREARFDAELGVILLDRPERSRHGARLLSLLEDILVECSRENLAAPLVFLITEQKLEGHPDLERLLLRLEFRAPDAKAREEYLDRRFICVGENNTLFGDELEKIRVHNVTPAQLVERTEGMSYQELEDLVSTAKLEILTRAFHRGIRRREELLVSGYPLTAGDLAGMIPRREEKIQAPADTGVSSGLEQALLRLAERVPAAGTQAAQVSDEKAAAEKQMNELRTLVQKDSYDPRKQKIVLEHQPYVEMPQEG